MKKFLNEALLRLGKALVNTVGSDDREVIAKVVSKTIASMVIFTVVLLSSAVMTVIADSLESAVPGMWLEALVIRIASFVLLVIDLVWLGDVALRAFRRSD